MGKRREPEPDLPPAAHDEVAAWLAWVAAHAEGDPDVRGMGWHAFRARWFA